MNKRQFLASLGASLVALPSYGSTKPAANANSPVLLTLTGAIGRANRGSAGALDQMMRKQMVQFDKAHAFDFAAITALPPVSIRPTLEYDSMPHQLAGPLLMDLLKAAGVKAVDTTKLFLRAVDGYVAAISGAEARRYRFIVATHLDGQPIPLGGLGPLWAVYDADRFPDMAAKPLNERFVRCPWALYHIDVQSA